MIRVGFVIADSGKNWVGGLNYMSNLLHAIRAVPDGRIDPVVICPPSLPPSVAASLPDLEVLRTALVEPSGLARYLRKGSERLIERDLPMERFLKAHRIDVLSHSGLLGRRARIPTLAWFPDFQHRHLPHLFDPAEIANRDRAANRFAEAATRIVVSSAQAQRDLERFFPSGLPKSRILHFVSGFGGVAAHPDSSDLRSRYDIQGPYFHLPNQFWSHKNHAVVVEALGALRSQGREALVIATGHTGDHRKPDYFKTLMARVEELGLGRSFRVLGLVPYEDLAGLMRHAVAVINPSSFEGWSTTVEEAKSQGKKLILSDIAVHREQNPERSAFFAMDDHLGLADLLRGALGAHSESEEEDARTRAAASLPERFTAFGRRYQTIVQDVC